MHVAKMLFHFFTSFTPLVSEQCVGTYLANNIIWGKKNMTYKLGCGGLLWFRDMQWVCKYLEGPANGKQMQRMNRTPGWSMMVDGYFS